MPAIHSRSPIRVGGPSIGLHRAGSHSWIGVAPPFGRLEAGALEHFASELETVGANEIRLTPWRTMVAAGLDESAAASLWARLLEDHCTVIPDKPLPRRRYGIPGHTGPWVPDLRFAPSGTIAEGDGDLGASWQSSPEALILDPDDPRLRVAACAGAPACPRATTPVQADAARLAAQLPPGPRGTQLHVSGCAKGCAHAGTARFTLVGRDGAYDLVRDGKASDAPERTTLSIEAIVAMLRMSDRVPAC